MNRTGIYRVALLFLPLLSGAPLVSENATLKDGSTVEGTIETVTIRTSNNQLKQVQRSDLSGVLFLNTTTVKIIGEPGSDRVTLSWQSPYDSVKKYRVYVRKNRNGKYELAESTGWKSVTVKNLKSKTDYYFMVTSINRDSIESPPGNELKVSTKNIPPERPKILSAEDTPSGERKFVWKRSIDPDGRVEKYRFYGTKDGKRTLIAESAKTEYLVKNAATYSRIELVAVDDSGEESGVVRKNVPNAKGDSYAAFQPGVIIPFGKMGKMYNIGYGGSLSYTRRNIFFENVEAGIEAGLYYATGKNLLTEGKPLYHDYLMVPILLHGAYRFELPYNLSIAPSLSVGVSYSAMKYSKRDAATFLMQEKTTNSVDQCIRAGLGIEYQINETFAISLSAEYGMFIEKDGPISFMVTGIGISYRF